MDNTQEFKAQFVCEAPDFLPPELRERLEFISCLAQKRDRSAWLCRDRHSGEKAVLKISVSDGPDSVSREYSLLGKLNHPAIPRAILHQKDEQGREYLLRAYAEGETLDRLIDRDGVFDERQTLVIIQKLCPILAYLHQQSPPIIYRDIKPQNIVITPNGKISLIDFGISREESSNKDFDTIYVGSVAFAAPEQFGFTKTDSRSDVFALGKLMLYLCSGETALPDFQQHVESKNLVRLIGRCTELSPEKRFASVQKLGKAIERILNPPGRREIFAAITAAVLVIAAGVFGLNRPPAELPATAPLNANGSGYEDQVKIPVLIEVLMDGRPFSDCAVAVDNHHWYKPAKNGQAELMVYEYDEYRARAAYQNQTAFLLTSVTKAEQPLTISFDLADVPSAPEYLPLSLPFGQNHEIMLEVMGASEVNISGQPEGMAIAAREDGFYLTLDETIAKPGHYTVFMESVNEFGKADTVLSIILEEQTQIIPISTAAELMKISENLSAHYVLVNDIDLSGIAHWQPVGEPDYPFTGSLDGAGHRITGLSYNELTSQVSTGVGLFGVVEGGIIRNLIIEDANISVSNASLIGNAVLVGRLIGGLVENCAVIGGRIQANIGLESSCGGVVGLSSGIIRNCFNSATVTIYTVGSKDRTECYAGGICGMSSGYVEYCGNIGAVTGISIAGGVVGFNDLGILTKSYNAGIVKSPVFAAEYLAGGVAHLLGRGKVISYCAFEKGTAQVGATVFNGGTLLSLIPLDKADFASFEALDKALGTDNARERWIYGDIAPGYPLPRGIF